MGSLQMIGRLAKAREEATAAGRCAHAAMAAHPSRVVEAGFRKRCPYCDYFSQLVLFALDVPACAPCVDCSAQQPKRQVGLHQHKLV